jgi:hypothetical protein
MEPIPTDLWLNILSHIDEPILYRIVPLSKQLHHFVDYELFWKMRVDRTIQGLKHNNITNWKQYYRTRYVSLNPGIVLLVISFIKSTRLINLELRADKLLDQQLVQIDQKVIHTINNTFLIPQVNKDVIDVCINWVDLYQLFSDGRVVHTSMGRLVESLIPDDVVELILTEDSPYFLDINGVVHSSDGIVPFKERIMKLVHHHTTLYVIGFSGTLYELRGETIREYHHSFPICQVGIQQSNDPRDHMLILDNTCSVYEIGEIVRGQIHEQGIPRFVDYATYLDLIDDHKDEINPDYELGHTFFGNRLEISEKFTKLHPPKGIIRLGLGEPSFLLAINGNSYHYEIDPRKEERFTFLHKDTYSAASPLLLVKE